MTQPQRLDHTGHRAPRLDFPVTAEIIAAATVRDSSHCMIADALRAALPTAEYVSVDLATIRFTDPAAGWRYIYLTPTLAQAALIDFDSGDKPEPFRVYARCAQMVPSGRRWNDKRNKPEGDDGTAPAQPNRARVRGAGDSENAVVKEGGDRPPIGPVHAGAGRNGRVQKGKRRQFGLRALIR